MLPSPASEDRKRTSLDLVRQPIPCGNQRDLVFARASSTR
jgi:hypothetical protein